MKKTIFTLFSLLYLGVNVACNRSRADWFVPSHGQVVLIYVDIGSHSEKQFDIKSSKALQLYIETNASYELAEKHAFAAPFPVQLKHLKSVESIGTIKGAGGVLFQPVDGIIPLLLKNGTDVPLRVVICSEPNS